MVDRHAHRIANNLPADPHAEPCCRNIRLLIKAPSSSVSTSSFSGWETELRNPHLMSVDGVTSGLIIASKIISADHHIAQQLSLIVD